VTVTVFKLSESPGIIMSIPPANGHWRHGLARPALALRLASPVTGVTVPVTVTASAPLTAESVRYHCAAAPGGGLPAALTGLALSGARWASPGPGPGPGGPSANWPQPGPPAARAVRVGNSGGRTTASCPQVRVSRSSSCMMMRCELRYDHSESLYNSTLNTAAGSG
jgi:hypothetical protein